MRLATALLFATLSGGLLAAESHSHFDARIGYHLVDPYDLSTHRYLLELSEKWEPISGWTLWAGARGMVAGVAQEQTQEVWLRDTFLQYRNDWLTVRAGNQRVVWGEVFGFYYADIVNPKDMRELGLGDLSLNRLSVPMIDVVVSFSAAALEFLAIPRPVFSKMPSVVGDFAFPFHDVVSSGSVSFGEDSGKDLSLSNAEFGLRGSKQWSGTDLSLFYFYYWDRIPTFTAFVVTPSPLSVSLTPFHARLSTVGLTASHDFSPFVLRLEGLYTAGRNFNVVTRTALTTFTSDEAVGVVECDYEGIEKTSIGLQYALHHIPQKVEGALIPQGESLLSFHVKAPAWNDSDVELITSSSLNDGGQYASINWTLPVSGQMELSLHADYFFGTQASQLGRYHHASRSYALLKVFF